MDVDVEAKRIMAVSINKLYASRSQRGGMRLHRSLLLSMVMRSARDIYHAACLAREKAEQTVSANLTAEEEEVPMDTGDAPSPQTEPAVTSEASVQSQTQSATETPELSTTISTTSAQDASHKASVCEEEEEEEGKETGEDKENRSPVPSPPSPPVERHSRKRRGKAAAAPDFLPSKRARLEPGLETERHRAGRAASSCRGAVDSLSSLSLNMAIAAF